MSPKNSRELKRLVLQLARGTEADRDWVLSTLQDPERSQLQALLSEAGVIADPSIHAPINAAPKGSRSFSDGYSAAATMSLLLSHSSEFAIRLRSEMTTPEAEVLGEDHRSKLLQAKLASAADAPIHITDAARGVLRSYIEEALADPPRPEQEGAAPGMRKRRFPGNKASP